MFFTQDAHMIHNKPTHNITIILSLGPDVGQPIFNDGIKNIVVHTKPADKVVSTLIVGRDVDQPLFDVERTLIPFGFSLLWHFLESFFKFLIYSIGLGSPMRVQYTKCAYGRYC